MYIVLCTYLVCQMMLKTVWSCEWYSCLWRTDTLLLCLLTIYDPEPYIIYNIFWLNDIIIFLNVIWNDTFNACLESHKYCRRIFTCICHNNPNVFTTVWYINIHLYNITQAYQYCILPYRMCVSFRSKCVYSNIQAYPARVYHVVQFSHYWSSVRTVTYRPINPVCTV